MGQYISKESEQQNTGAKTCGQKEWTFDEDVFDSMCTTDTHSFSDDNLTVNIDPSLKSKLCQLNFKSGDSYHLHFSDGKPSSCGLCERH